MFIAYIKFEHILINYNLFAKLFLNELLFQYFADQI